MSQTKPIIGLCGGIGAGKSRVAAEFERLGCVVVDSDRLNHEILRRGVIVTTLRGWWGDAVLAADGQLDRKRIAEIVFADGEQKRRLESLLHPLIAERRVAIIEQANRDPAVKAIILNSPLLFESSLDRLCDKLVFVHASETERLRRVRRTRSWELGDLRRREEWQGALTEKRSRCDFVIDNEGPETRLQPRVAEILRQIG